MVAIKNEKKAEEKRHIMYREKQTRILEQRRILDFSSNIIQSQRTSECHFKLRNFKNKPPHHINLELYTQQKYLKNEGKTDSFRPAKAENIYLVNLLSKDLHHKKY